MISRSDHLLLVPMIAAVCGIVFAVTPASAQWSRITDIPATDVFSFFENGDTLVAGTDSVVYVSTNQGLSWHASPPPAVNMAAIDAVRIRNGRLYAGTFGQGVFVSDDLGASWQAFNQGLVGGVFDSQLDVFDFEVRGDSLYAATLGAGVYVRRLDGPGTWSHFGEEFEPEQASTVNDITLGGTRLLASAGGNGMVFRRDPGEPEWTISNLDNIGIHAGLMAQSAIWNGVAWVVGTNLGIFTSAEGQEPWTRFDPRLGALSWTQFAKQKQQIYGAFVTANFTEIERSDDDGATWQELETLPLVFMYRLAIVENNLYAAQTDGLWRRSIDTASVGLGGDTRSLRFALNGPQPVGDHARLRFEMPASGTASIDVFDVLGRRVGDPVEASWSQGSHEVSLNTRQLGPGVYAARLTAGGAHEVVRLVHVR